MSAPLPNPQPTEFAQLDLVNSPIFVLEVDEDGVPRYVAFNTCAREKTDKPLSYYLGRPATEVYPQAYGRTAYARHCEVARTGKTKVYELDLPLANAPHSIRTTLVPYVDPVTGRKLLYGSSIDMTAEQATRERQVSFDTLTKEMEQFIALAAHDLRAPMRNMATLASMLKEGFVDHGDGKTELLDMMEDVASKSMVLISDVLSHARSVDLGTSRTKFDLSELCQDICDVLDPHEHHQFSCTSAQVSTDRTAMQIALRNIIDNAIKYGNKTPLSIDVRVQRGTSGMLDVVISDDGHGFSGAAIKFLNGGAFRSDSGYGLLGVRRMVEARGGTITASNNLDAEGAIIRFNLPGDWLGTASGLEDLIDEWSKDARLDALSQRRSA
jgi:signal transduction histidine kinase